MSTSFSLPFATTYKGKPATYRNPEDERNKDGSHRDPADKVTDKEYFLEKAQYLYAAYLDDNFTIGYTSNLQYAINRSYSFGNQSNAKYMDIVSPKNKNGIRKAFVNFSWDNLPIYPKFRDLLKNRLDKVDYQLQVDAVEEDLILEKQRLKMLAWVKEQETEFIQALYEATGMPSDEQVPQEQLPIKPKSMSELDMMEGMGSFKLPLEISLLKKINEVSLPMSHWPQVKLKMAEDGIDLGIFAGQCYSDAVDGTPKVRYVDPAYLIVRQTRDNSFERIADAAEIRFMTIAQLREYGLSEPELKQAAQAYNNMLTNGSWPQDQWNNFDLQQNLLDRWVVAVLDMDFESFCTRSMEYRSVGDMELAFELPAGSDKPSSKKNKFAKNRYMRRYRGKWVIGTQIMFDYGYQYDVPYDDQNMPLCSYKVYRCAERSLTSRCIATIDDMQLAVLKFRAAWAKAKPSGIRVEWGSISNMVLGGEKMDPKDILRMYNQSGDLIYKAQTIDGRFVQGQAPPIEELKGGMGPLLGEFIETFKLHLETLRELTAIGQVTDGSTGNGDQLVGVVKIAEAATSDAHRNVLTGVRHIKELVAADLCIRWQNYAILNGEAKSQPYGGTGLEIIRLSAQDAKRRVRVICQAEIDDAMKEQILLAAQTSLAAAKQGAAGITMSDYFCIMDALQKGNLKYAAMFLHFREEEQKNYQMKMQQENMQMNGQNMQMQEKMKADAAMALEDSKKETILLETESKIAVEREKGNQARQTAWFENYLLKGVMNPPSSMPGSAPAPAMQPQPAAPAMPMGDPSQMQGVPAPEQGMPVGQPAL